MIVSFIGGAIACVALARLAKFEFGREAAAIPSRGRLRRRPTAVFMSAPYTEAPFLMFALPAWLAGSQGQVAWACILAACACLFRISALFLVAALGVQFLVHADWRRIRDLVAEAVRCSCCRWSRSVPTSPSCTTRPATGSGGSTPRRRSGTGEFTWPWDALVDHLAGGQRRDQPRPGTRRSGARGVRLDVPRRRLVGDGHRA